MATPGPKSPSGYVRPTDVVTAHAGDTVEKIADRLGVDAVELAKFNGLLPNSVLGAGREIKVPPRAARKPETKVPAPIVPKPVCEIDIANSPTVRGLKLGMPESDAALLIRETFKRGGVDPIYYRWAEAATMSRAPFEQIEFVSLESFDRKISEIVIQYDEIKWKNVQEFVDAFAPKMGLPAEGWDVDVYERARLKCKGFTVELDALTTRPRLTLHNTDADAKVAGLKAQFEEDKKKAIKP